MNGKNNDRDSQYIDFVKLPDSSDETLKILEEQSNAALRMLTSFHVPATSLGDKIVNSAREKAILDHQKLLRSSFADHAGIDEAFPDYADLLKGLSYEDKVARLLSDYADMGRLVREGGQLVYHKETNSIAVVFVDHCDAPGSLGVTVHDPNGGKG